MTFKTIFRFKYKRILAWVLCLALFFGQDTLTYAGTEENTQSAASASADVTTESESADAGDLFVDLSSVLLQEGNLPTEEDFAVLLEEATADGEMSEELTEELSSTMDLESAGTKKTDQVVSALESLVDAWDGTTSSATLNVYNCRIPTSYFLIITYTLLYENPQFFYLDTSIGGYAKGDYIYSITVHYRTDLYDASSIVTFNEAVQDVLSGVEDSWSEVEKLLYLHDYLVTHCQYDSVVANATTSSEVTSLNVYSVYSVLVNQDAVCQGYALTYRYLANLLGLDVDIVISEDLNHAWNVVALDGAYYYVDCTWEEQSALISGTVTFACETYCTHEYFLLSEETFYKTHDTTDWTDGDGDVLYGNLTTNSTYENYFWVDSASNIVYYDGVWVYTDVQSGDIYTHSFDNETDSLYLDITDWAYDTVTVYGDYLIYNDKTHLYLYDGSESIQILETDSDAIYGATVGIYYVSSSNCYTCLARTYSLSDYTVAVTGVNLYDTDVTLVVGDTMDLSYTVYPAYASNTEVTFESSDTGVVSVTSDGTLTGIASGSAEVTITTADGAYVDTCTVTVKTSGTSSHSTASNLSSGYRSICNTSTTETDESQTSSQTTDPVSETTRGDTSSESTSDSAVNDTSTQGSVSGAISQSASVVIKVISLAKAKIKKVVAKKKKLTVTWKAVSGATGYEIRYSTSSSMKKSKVLKTASLKKVLKNLKRKATNYVQVRAYTVDANGNKVYGSWSAKKKCKTK